VVIVSYAEQLDARDQIHRVQPFLHPDLQLHTVVDIVIKLFQLSDQIVCLHIDLREISSQRVPLFILLTIASGNLPTGNILPNMLSFARLGY
jgi:hypothetical protein